ncbi:MAG: capsular polysaccharide biosynthesis protein [Aestuariivirga sp.]
MAGTVQIHTTGLWRLRRQIGAMTGLEPVRALPFAAAPSAVAGWGRKPTAASAQRAAASHGVPYVAFEDGFLRSLHPGTRTPPASLVMDRRGIYYDASGPSDLEHLLENHRFSPAELEEAEAVRAEIRLLRLSKYSSGMDREFAIPSGSVLLIDQTMGDASIAGALADSGTFAVMVDQAVTENPGARVFVKLHPEVMNGAKLGYLRAIAEARGLTLLGENLNPWCLLDAKPKVYTVSSQFGFEALLAGCQVHCFGLPFYAGWGLTRDRKSTARRSHKRSATELAAAAYLLYPRYFDQATVKPIDCLTAIRQLGLQRQRYVANTLPSIGYRIALRKRHAVRLLLEGPSASVRFTSSLKRAEQIASATGARIVAWGSDATSNRDRLSAKGIDLVAMEDGYVRSIGLGAAFAPPMSFCADAKGIYFDPSRPSDLEELLENLELSKQELARAARLRRTLSEQSITKYNLTGQALRPASLAGRKLVLAIGQAADDMSIRLGAPKHYAAEPLSAGGANLALLKAVRIRHPDAYLIYKPHPDVEAGLCAGAIAPERVSRLADSVAVKTSITSLFQLNPHVETLTSLAGFEALLRDLTVTCHGQPFYAGWGLTEDVEPPPNRRRRLTIDHLVYGALISYPRYFTRDARLEITPEQALEIINAKRHEQPGALRTLDLRFKTAFGQLRYRALSLFR